MEIGGQPEGDREMKTSSRRGWVETCGPDNRSSWTLLRKGELDDFSKAFA